MPTLEVNGVNLFWSEKGTGDPVVFAHGIPTDYRAWEGQTSVLSGGFRTITYSRRYAHPNSRDGDPLDSTIENNATDLAGSIAKLGLAPAHVVGHSYGGFIAAFLAARQPELLWSLTLVEPAIDSLLLRNPRSRAEAIGLLLRHPRIALSPSRFLRHSNGPALEALRRNDLPCAVRCNLDGVENRKNVLAQLPEPVQTMRLDTRRTVEEADTPYPVVSLLGLRNLRVDTLMIHGQTSAHLLRAIAEMAGAAIPRCQTVTIPGSGHYPHVQIPSAFNAALLRFLERAPASH